jgi:hypothetical protein
MDVPEFRSELFVSWARENSIPIEYICAAELAAEELAFQIRRVFRTIHTSPKHVN